MVVTVRCGTVPYHTIRYHSMVVLLVVWYWYKEMVITYGDGCYL